MAFTDNSLESQTRTKQVSVKVPYQSLIFFYLVTSSVVRIILWVSFGGEGELQLQRLPLAVCVGILQDLLALLFLTLPLTLLHLMPSVILYSKQLRKCAGVGVFLLLFGALFLFVAEYLFFDEFNSRFNLVAVDYFAYPTEVLGNIWESYPVGPVIAGGLLCAALLVNLVWPPLQRFFYSRTTWSRRLRFVICHVALCLAFLRWGSIEGLTKFTNRVEAQISQNGILTFFQAAWTNDIQFDHFYATLGGDHAYTLMRDVLKEKGGQLVSTDPYNLTRRFAAKSTGLGKLNVVMIAEESLGAQYLGILGDKRGLTPNFDRLSKNGLLFENAYATGTRTVRGLEALSMSLPPIPSESTVKRPGNEGMANFGEVLNRQGYASKFIYGGFGAFDNMNYFFGHNGFQLIDRMDVKNVTYSNIWGVCDEDLFNHALSVFDQSEGEKKPFFAIVMTTSNHKPFTFPPGLSGIPESGGGREAGVKYADYALGKFFERAKEHSWYNNTIFVVVGDHDSRVYGRAYIPVERYRVALLILAPGHLEPGRVPNVTSHIDVMPTVMGLLGLPYEGPFYGRDMLESEAPMYQPVLLNHNHNVGLFHKGHLSVTSLNRELKTFRYENDGKTIEIQPDGEALAQLTAYLQTAYEAYRDHKYTLPAEH